MRNPIPSAACKLGDRLVIVRLEKGSITWAEVDSTIKEIVQKYSIA